MADDRYPNDYHPPGRSEEAAQRPYQSQYPDPQRLPEVQRPAMSAPQTQTLPSIHDASRVYAPPPRYPSPGATNGYSQPQHLQHPPPPPPPPHPRQPPPPGQGAAPYPLPPPSTQPPGPYADPRAAYYDARHPYEQYQPDPYYRYRQPPGLPPPNGYPGHPHPGHYVDYPPPQANGPPLAQAAPRQRTSIACRYCRKRKIRCSGYQSAPGGKCQNCARMNQECIFQPVSSSSSTAFVPVSAVPGGVPPGTPLYGAYGQPLAPNSVPPPPPPPHPIPYQLHHPPYYPPPIQSPTGSYSSYGDPRGDESQLAGRRRRRTPEDQDESYRLPPPRSATDDDPRRRSPAEKSNNSSPGGINYAYGGARQSPRNLPAPLMPQPQPSSAINHTSAAPNSSRSPTIQNGSSGASTPARHGQAATALPPNQQPSQQGDSVKKMSLSNLLEKNDIDQTMIDRLNRPQDRDRDGNRDRNRDSSALSGQNGTGNEGSLSK